MQLEHTVYLVFAWAYSCHPAISLQHPAAALHWNRPGQPRTRSHSRMGLNNGCFQQFDCQMTTNDFYCATSKTILPYVVVHFRDNTRSIIMSFSATVAQESLCIKATIDSQCGASLYWERLKTFFLMSIFIVRANKTLRTPCIHLSSTTCSDCFGHHQVDSKQNTWKRVSG